MKAKQKRDQYRPKVRASRNYCLQPASDAILEFSRLKRPEPERESRNISASCLHRFAKESLKRPEPERESRNLRQRYRRYPVIFV